MAKEEVNNSCLFADRLASLMRQRRLKHRELAEIAGVSKAAVGKWLRGTTPGSGELFKIARALGVPMESFFDAIPYVTPPAEALHSAALETPIAFLSPKIRKAQADALEVLSSPQGREVFADVLMRWAAAASAPQGGQKKTSIRVL